MAKQVKLEEDVWLNHETGKLAKKNDLHRVLLGRKGASVPEHKAMELGLVDGPEDKSKEPKTK